MKKRKFIEEDKFLHMEVLELEIKLGISWDGYLEQDEETDDKEE